MRSIAQTIERFTKKLTDNMISALKNNQDNIAAAALSDVYPEIRGELETRYEEVITRFYGAFSPEYYIRNHRLFNLLEITLEGNVIQTEFRPERMTPFRAGGATEGGIYTLVFRQGYHGGAPMGNPWYRGPVDQWSHYTRPAVVTDPPLTMFQAQATPYLNGPARDLFNRACYKFVKDLVQQIGG